MADAIEAPIGRRGGERRGGAGRGGGEGKTDSVWPCRAANGGVEGTGRERVLEGLLELAGR